MRSSGGTINGSANGIPTTTAAATSNNSTTTTTTTSSSLNNSNNNNNNNNSTTNSTTPSPNGTLRDSAAYQQQSQSNGLNTSGNHSSHTSKHVRAKSQSANEDIEDKFFSSKLDTFKTFVQTTLHSMKARKTHTCKVTAITTNDKLELFVSDGTFGTEVSSVKLKMKLK